MAGWRAYAWVGIWLLGSAFGQVEGQGFGLVLALLAGTVAGAAWQVVARRDVAERLTWLSGWFLGSGLAFALADVLGGEARLDIGAGQSWFIVAVVSSVVLTERVLRRRALGHVTLDMVHAPDESAAARRQG